MRIVFPLSLPHSFFILFAMASMSSSIILLAMLLHVILLAYYSACYLLNQLVFFCMLLIAFAVPHACCKVQHDGVFQEFHCMRYHRRGYYQISRLYYMLFHFSAFLFQVF